MESKTSEFTPRAYQIDLYEIARKHNTIIYLPTGAGKTFIAVMLIKELSADIRKPYNEGGKHTIYLVNTVSLVEQQCEFITRVTGLKCRALSGDKNVDHWKELEWVSILENSQVLVMTAQILMDAICHGFVLLNRINLLIFDECHRAVNDHPMRQIMKLFENCPKEEQPKILGLTACLLNSNVKLDKVQSIIESLEITLHAKVATVNSLLQVQNYYAKPVETIVKFDKYVIPDIGKRINCVICEITEILKSLTLESSSYNMECDEIFKPVTLNRKLMRIINSIEEELLCTGIYGANKFVLLHLIQLECIKKSMENVETVYCLEYIITELIKLRKLLNDEMEGITEREKIYKYSSDQVRKLFSILKQFYTSKCNQNFCCMIFVERRFTAKVLYQILKSLSICDEEFKFLQPDFIIGFSTNPYKTPKEKLCISKWNRETIHRFKSGLSNCIVATDIMDEGIDVPKCTLIVRFNLPMNIRAYIQSKGRARNLTSQYTLLVSNDDDENYLKRYENFKVLELYLQQLLIGQENDCEEPTQDDIENELYANIIEPYIVVNENGVKHTLSQYNAISLVNNYCNALLNSKFVKLSVTWKLHKTHESVLNIKRLYYQISLKLPSVSPLKTIIFGDVMNSIRNAKRSAAMKTCIALHKIGELSDRLLPNVKNSILQNNAEYLFPNWVDEDKSETSLIGTYKKKRQHQLQFPLALYSAYPLPNESIYLHLFHVKPIYSIPHNDNRHLIFYNLLSNNASFGILSAKQMPEIPVFPIFMGVGELNVDVKVNYAEMNLTEEEISYIKIFHTLIFNQIVPVIKFFMVFDNYNLDNCFLIVPVDENWDINWKVIKQYQNIERIPPPVPFHFRNNDYELALVIPNYRASADVYIVTQVCDDLTPGSCFPTDNFFTYADYYEQKHGLAINNLKQPMLEVKPISRKINFIKPRIMSELKKHKHTESIKDLKEHLVPELCIRIKFPALYWLKATMLPSILHRISQLLIAEDLRCIIALEAHLGSLSNEMKWPPLIIEEKREESFESSIEVPIDESVESLQPEPVLSGPEVDVLSTELYHYPWTKDQEPPDLFKNIEEIQMIHIKHYHQFMSETWSSENVDIMKNKITFIDKLFEPNVSLKILSVKGSCPDPVQIMYALTSKLGQDAFNLELLEILGDSYLKFITSLFLYNTFPNHSEGPLTILKGKIIGNRNLYYCGAKKHIPGRMKVDDFIPFSTFIAPAYATFRELQTVLLDAEVSPNVLYEIQIPEEEQFTGQISKATKNLMKEKVLHWESAELQTGMEHFLGIQTVSDKTVADCVEALIGAYVTSMGIRETIKLLKWFEILPNNIEVDVLLCNSSEDSIISDENVNYFMPWAADIETTLGYKFQNRAFLLQAFTHPSYTANNITDCYQRLEFLGDAVLDFLITCYIYENCKSIDPGKLTDLRSALVNNVTLACLAVRNNLHTALLAYAPAINDSINSFVKFQENRGHVVNDELLWTLLEENECNVVEHVDVPKVLGDIFESTIGAIYLDCGKNLEKVWEIILNLMYKEIDEFSKNIPKQPIRVLYETQGTCPQFLNSIVVEGTNSVMVPLKVVIAGKTKLFHGVGTNKKQAKCAAAKQALRSLLYKT